MDHEKKCTLWLVANGISKSDGYVTVIFKNLFMVSLLVANGISKSVGYGTVIFKNLFMVIVKQKWYNLYGMRKGVGYVDFDAKSLRKNVVRVCIRKI
jgi:hypothetical protein